MEFYDSGSCEERSVPQTENEIESFKEKPGVNEVFFFVSFAGSLFMFIPPLL